MPGFICTIEINHNGIAEEDYIVFSKECKSKVYSEKLASFHLIKKLIELNLVDDENFEVNPNWKPQFGEDDDHIPFHPIP
jgi:hypothetical protein